MSTNTNPHVDSRYNEYQTMHSEERPKRHDILEHNNGNRWVCGGRYRGHGGELRINIRSQFREGGIYHELYPTITTVRTWINDGAWTVYYRE
jgi:hypothetical protein